jgi:hypothetical protein
MEWEEDPPDRWNKDLCDREGSVGNDHNLSSPLSLPHTWEDFSQIFIMRINEFPVSKAQGSTDVSLQILVLRNFLHNFSHILPQESYQEKPGGLSGRQTPDPNLLGRCRPPGEQISSTGYSLGQISIAPWTDWPPPREKEKKNLNNKHIGGKKKDT